MKPFISVILPVYNGGPYLKDSVQSVLGQSLQAFEFLILDDCSTDGSREYVSTLQDSRIRLFRNNENKGLFFNLNFLVGETTSPLIKLWSQDDVMYPSCLEEFARFHRFYPRVGFSYSGCDRIDETGTVSEKATVDKTPQLVSTELHARIAFFTGSIAGNIANVCLSKKALEEVGLFNEQMRISGDFDMWVRLAKDHPTGFLPAKLIQLRDHAAQLSRKEELYINHVREDLTVYRYLQSYVAPAVRKEGQYLLRHHKLVFYYTLMVKTLLKGKFSSGFQFFRELSGFDDFFILTWCFLRAKLIGVKKPTFATAPGKKMSKP